MKEGVVFNREIKKYFKEVNSDLTNYLEDKADSYDYLFFFEDFLFNYGIVSFMSRIVLDSENKYMPTINCEEHNIFNEEGGFRNLSANILSLKKSEEVLAHYLISKLTFMSIEKFENWKNFK